MQAAPKHFWHAVFQRQTLLIALTASALVHAAAYVATHDLALRWRPLAADSEPIGGVALNAVLVAAENDTTQKIVAAPNPTAPKTTAKSTAQTSPTARKNIASLPAKSAAPFAARENAIAVDASASPLAQGEPETVSDTITAAASLPEGKDGKESNNPKPEIAPVAPLTAPVNEATSVTETDAAPASEPAYAFPQRISMAYKISSSIADGIADFSFNRSGADGRDYELKSTIQATGIFAGLFVGTFRQTSRGEMTYNGIRPTFFSMQRGDAAADTAEFMRDKRTLKVIKHGETHLFPLPPRLQDTQSFLFQLAQEARQLRTPEDRIKVALTNARKLYRYEFRTLGEETLQTRMGILTTLHLKSDAVDPEDVYEVWLSPKHFYLPVKIKFYMGKFLVEQTVRSIDATEN